MKLNVIRDALFAATIGVAVVAQATVFNWRISNLYTPEGGRPYSGELTGYFIASRDDSGTTQTIGRSEVIERLGIGDFDCVFSKALGSAYSISGRQYYLSGSFDVAIDLEQCLAGFAVVFNADQTKFWVTDESEVVVSPLVDSPSFSFSQGNAVAWYEISTNGEGAFCEWTVTFEMGEYGWRTGGGELVQWVTNGCFAVAPTVAVVETNGWRFTGWDGDVTAAITNDTTFVAQYEPVYTWSYDDNGDGTITITSVSPEPEGDLAIPSAIAGMRVTSIGESAFYNCSGLTSVTIPDGVTSIEGQAFSCCSALTSVTIPDSVIEIGWRTFEGCANLNDVKIPSGITSINAWMFVGCGLTSVTIPANVERIWEGAFSCCGYLTNVTMLGDAPMIYSSSYGYNHMGSFSDVSSDCTVYVSRSSTGWGVEIPGTWNGLKIEYFDDDPMETFNLHEAVEGMSITSAEVNVPELMINVTVKLNSNAEWDKVAEAMRSKCNVEVLSADTLSDGYWRRTSVEPSFTNDCVFRVIMRRDGVWRFYRVIVSENGDGLVSSNILLCADRGDGSTPICIVGEKYSDFFMPTRTVAMDEWWGRCLNVAQNDRVRFLYDLDDINSYWWGYTARSSGYKQPFYAVVVNEDMEIEHIWNNDIRETFSDTIPNSGFFDWDVSYRATGRYFVGFLPQEYIDGGYVREDIMMPEELLDFGLVEVKVSDLPLEFCTVTFDLGGHGHRVGGGDLVQSVAYGNAVPQVPEVVGDGNWLFVGWDGDVTAAITGDTTFTAQYEAFSDGVRVIDGVTNFWLEVEQPERGGSIGYESGWHTIDDMFFVQYSVDAGYRFVDWTGDVTGLYQQPNGNKLFVVMDMPRTIGVAVAPIEYDITYLDVRGAANHNPTNYNVENWIDFTPLADVDGWKFTGWEPSCIPTGTVGNVNVTAQWARANVSVSVNGETVTYNYGDTSTFTAPEAWETNGMQVVTLGTTFTAPVVTNVFTVTVTNNIGFTWDILATNYWFDVAEARNGVVEVRDGGDSLVTYPGWVPDGTLLTLEAIPTNLYHFVGWTGDWQSHAVDSTNETANPLVVLMDGARTIGAEFAVSIVTVIDAVTPSVPTEDDALVMQGHAENGTAMEYLWRAVNRLSGSVSVLGRAQVCRANLPMGDWRIEFLVRDVSGVWSEPASVDVAVAEAVAAPDLQVVRADVSFFDDQGLPTSLVKTGEVVTVRAVVQNRGAAGLADGARVYLCDGIVPVGALAGLSVDDPRILAQGVVPALGAGRSRIAELTWVVGRNATGGICAHDAYGPNAFTVAAVPLGGMEVDAFAENNLASMMLELGETGGTLADLLHVSVNCENTTWEGESYAVSGYVWYERRGAHAVMAGASVVLSIDGEVAGEAVTDASGRYVCAFTAPSAGQHTAKVKVTDGMIVKTATASFTSAVRNVGGGDGGGTGEVVPVVQGANLAVSAIVCTGGARKESASSYAAFIGDEVGVSAIVVNTSDVAVTNGFTVAFEATPEDGDAPRLNVEVPVTETIAPGESVVVAASNALTLTRVTRWLVRAVADIGNEVAEYSETDNSGRVWLTAEERKPNLTVSGISLSESRPTDGCDVTATVTVVNDGSTAVTNEFIVSFTVGGAVYTASAKGGLAIGEKTELAFIVRVAEGTVRMTVTADEGCNVDESDETDNTYSRTLRVYPAEAMVTPVSLTANPYPSAGQTSVLTATFRNDGGAAYTGGMAVFYAGDPVAGRIGQGTVGQIAWRGGTGTATCAWTPADDAEHTVSVMLAGRTYTATFSRTPPPDLRVMPDDISFEPGTPMAGDAVRFRAMVRNVGQTSAATNVAVLFTIAGADGITRSLTTVTVPTLVAGGSMAVDADVPFIAERGIYTVETTVRDGMGREANPSDNVAARVFGVNMPVADAVAETTGIAGDVIMLDGTGSSEASRFLWTLIEAPSGNREIVSNETAITASFVPQIAGIYRFALVVSDGTAESAPAECIALVDKVRVTAISTSGGVVTPNGEVICAAGALPSFCTSPDMGYRFIGWNCDITMPLVSNTTFVAQYAVIPYAIAYMGLKGATNPNPATYTVEDEISFATPGGVYGWVFRGWTPGSIALGTTGAVEVVAGWERQKFDVTVNGETRQHDYEDEVTLVTNAFINAGATQYVCTGWAATNADPSSGDGATAEFKVLGDVSFEWHWVTNVLTIAQAVNAEALEWTTSGAAGWIPEWSNEASDALHCARSGAVNADEESVVSVSVSGPGTLSFDWRSNCGEADYFTLQIDGRMKRRLSGVVAWTNVTETLAGAGPHMIRWVYRRNSPGSAKENAVWLDNVRWTAAGGDSGEPTLKEALGEDFEWETVGDVAWRAVRYGRDCYALAEGLGDGQCATLRTSVHGAGRLVFYWSVSCEFWKDWFDFYVDGELCETITGWTTDDGWSVVEVELGDGLHELEWCYWKDGSDKEELAGENVAMLDGVSWHPAGEEPPSVSGSVINEFLQWLKDHGQVEQEQTASAATAIIKARLCASGKKMSLYDEFVAGTNPNVVGEEFAAIIEMLPDGTPDVKWKPYKPELLATRTFTTYGKKTLDDSSEWTPLPMNPVTDADREQYRQYHFFKVEVKMK